jgi:zinc transport system substrate-binding protein
MKVSKTWAALLLIVILTAAVVAISGCNDNESSDKLKVAVSIEPLADFSRQIGGDKVEVQCVVPASAGCGHTFEPTPGTMEFLSEAKVFIQNGLGLESWASDVLKRVARPDVISVVAASAVPEELLMPSQDSEQRANAGPGVEINDPHVWLDPSLAIYEVEAIRDAFVEADPTNSSTYNDNAYAYINRLKLLDNDLQEELAPIKGASFIATHPTWTYFAPRYGLNQIGEVEELPGKEPSAQQIGELVKKVREMQVKAVFAEPQLNPKAMEIIANDAGPDVKVSVVDPVGDPQNPEVSDYMKLMRHNADVMLAALQ